MAIDPIAIDTAPLFQPSQSPIPSPSTSALPQPSPDAGSATPVAVDQVRLSGGSVATFQQLQLNHDQSNADAGAIRNADRSLQALGQKIDALKAPLETIVKNFPPFSPQDQARMKLLMKYSSLRKEIDELTVPAPPDIVKARKADALPAPLPQDATDSQIADHVAKLDAAGAALNDTRAGIAADTASLLHDGRFARIFSPPGGAQTGLSELPPNDSAAAQKSAQVGRQFASLVSQGVIAGGSQFLKGLS